MNIVFIGMKHCGKSTHGRALAAEMQYKFYDTDDVLQDSYNRRNGRNLSIREIYAETGADGFKALEESVMDRLVKIGSHNVVSMGGGMPVNDRIQEQMKELGLIVFLKLPVKVLFERVRRRGLPSFIDPKRPLENFTELYKQREPYYLKSADLIIELEDMPLGEARKVIFNKIMEKIDAR